MIIVQWRKNMYQLLATDRDYESGEITKKESEHGRSYTVLPQTAAFNCHVTS